MLNTFSTLHFGKGLELLLARMLRIRELELRSSTVPYKFWIQKVFKTVLEKVFEKIWLTFIARLQSDLCILPLGQRPVFREVEDSMCFLMDSYPSVQLLSWLPQQLLFLIHILTGEARLWNVDAEAWSKLSVFCKARVCFSAVFNCTEEVRQSICTSMLLIINMVFIWELFYF